MLCNCLMLEVDSAVQCSALHCDYQGHICGWGEGEMADRPFTLMFDMTQCLNPAYLVEGCLTPQVWSGLV